MALTQSESAQWLSVVVRLSRKAYYPGAVVSGVITIEPATESDEGEYISFISAQLHGHIGIVPNFATFPKELKRGKQKNNPVSYGNVNKFVNDTTDCLYQTSSMILDSDVSLQSQKAYFFQITLPKDIPPSLKTNCVRYFHLLSFCFFDKKSESHFISIPLNVLLPSSYNFDDEYTFSVSSSPIKSPSFSKDITEEYRDRASITVTEQPKPSTTIPLSEAIPLEFDALYQIDVNQSSEDAKWANSRFITSYPDFMSATPNAANAGDMESLSRRPQTHIGIFTVTHNGESLCNVQLTADPIIHGDVIQMVADFSDVQIPCEQMTISLYYEEYSAYLRGKIVRSDLVSTISVMTRHIQKYPYSFSIPVVYPPTLQTEQVRIGWKLQFSFLFLKKREKEAKEEYVFDPEQFLSQAMTKVDWSYEVKVRSCVNERFNDALTEECEL
ncbi:hypothetical protein WA556_000456, partial [Blastocystis sp. ATCC 50177/Nand II]